MPLGCGLQVCKYILGFFNFLIFLCGGAVLGVGIWIAVDKSSVLSVLKASEAIASDPNVQSFDSPSVLEQAAYILIVAGSIVFLLGFLGCCGAFHESKCMLGTYAFFLTAFLLVEIAAGVYAAVAKDRFESDLKKTSVDLLKKRYTEPEDAITLSWNKVFAEFECCGVNNYRDLDDSEWKKKQSDKTIIIPKACCKLNDKEAFLPVFPDLCQRIPDSENYANTGCYDAIIKWAKKHLTIIIGVGIGLGLIQLFAVIFSCCLCCALDPK